MSNEFIGKSFLMQHGQKFYEHNTGNVPSKALGFAGQVFFVKCIEVNRYTCVNKHGVYVYMTEAILRKIFNLRKKKSITKKVKEERKHWILMERDEENPLILGGYNTIEEIKKEILQHIDMDSMEQYKLIIGEAFDLKAANIDLVKVRGR